MTDTRSMAARLLRRGDWVIHPEFGAASVTKIVESTGAVWLKLDEDGLEGTCCAELLKWEK